MNYAGRTWIAFIVAAIVTIVAIAAMPRYDISPKGIVLPLLVKQPKYFSTVNVYDRVTVPLDAKTVGSISLLYHTRKDTAVEQQAVLLVAKQMAAAAGADGLLIFQMGHTYPGTPAAMAVMVLRGSIVKNHGF